MKGILKSFFTILVFASVSTWCSSCKDFLAASPNRDLNELDNLEDLQRLLDQSTHNSEYPSSVMLCGESYYIRTVDWVNSTNAYEKACYIWSKDVFVEDDWYYTYRRLFDQNLVLKSLGKLNVDKDNEDFKRIKGTALFLRAYNMYHLSQALAPQYSSATLNTKTDIALLDQPVINETRGDATVKEIYESLVGDCLVAKNLLPDIMIYNTRPSKAAVWALLGKIYLQMGEYRLSGQAADSSLKYQPTLLDFNRVDSTVAAPFVPKDNPEVLFLSLVRTSSFMGPSTCKVDSVLYKSYGKNDLRKGLFFQRNTDGSFRFRGNYNGTVSAFLFNGLGADEVYLIAAEARARLGEIESSMTYLNKMAEKRYKAGSFSGFNPVSQEEALSLVLSERRKEMIFRGVRWSDLKRLNLDERFKDTIARVVDNVAYKLLPNSPQYKLGLTKP
ncbi:RagB/SusD family nutrient uptake outer membrane protein [Chitinophaga sedimenti]|uniref:RagB/SusD family nutrient uptake outer membrane protein n=1 Tax=Chitinophaga sedimenti TaxID=2033606 RepID=UPI002004EB8B|nr:RagB/SusD family nutrient uptake outer membrane protein [Chitinophaga sedimenti]MCK7554503.1 RagB/SusD family nutrient uptake outer membrane protein [Chitinophaga sedimenti]